MERDFAGMPAWQHKLLTFDYKTDRIERLKKCTFTNQLFLNLVVADWQALFDKQILPNGAAHLKPEPVRSADVVKMRSTLKSFAREWSE